jgi:hypothetical protein
VDHAGEFHQSLDFGELAFGHDAQTIDREAVVRRGPQQQPDLVERQRGALRGGGLTPRDPVGGYAAARMCSCRSIPCTSAGGRALCGIGQPRSNS